MGQKEKSHVSIGILDCYHAAQLQPLLYWCDYTEYTTRWKDIKVKTEGYHCSKYDGKLWLLFNKFKNMLDPMTKFTPKIWFTTVRKYNLQKDIKVHSWFFMRRAPWVGAWGAKGGVRGFQCNMARIWT